MATWAKQWRFTFCVGPTKSAAMVFGPARLVPFCAVTVARVPLPQISEYPYLGVTLTYSLNWNPHIRTLIARGNRLFVQCVSWCRSEHLPLVFASNLFHTYVLPNVLWGAVFCSGSVPAVRLQDGTILRWSRCLLGWPRGSPIPAVHLESGWHHKSVVVPVWTHHLHAHGKLFSASNYCVSCNGLVSWFPVCHVQ